MYWILECYRDPDVGGRTIESWPDIPGADSWMSGSRFEGPIPQPIELYWDPEDEEGPAQSLYLTGIPMMTKRLHNALREAGVNNLDVYAILIRSHSSAEVSEEFLAFNVIGLVRAADLGNSNHIANDPPLIAHGFDSLAINAAAANGMLCFRLAENVSALVIHDRVKQHLEKASPGLTFEAPEDWFG